MPWHRREFIRNSASFALGTAATAAVCNPIEAQAPFYYVGVAANRTNGYSATMNAIQSLPPGEFPEVAGRIVIIKVNLVGQYLSSTGATTDPLVAQAIVDYSLQNGAASIVIVEGGQVPRNKLTETTPPFAYCGYTALFSTYANVQLVDLDAGPMSTVPVPNGVTFDQIQLSSVLLQGNAAGPPVLISAAKMKTHTWAVATLSIKNWFGCYPPAAYNIESFICRGVPHVLGLPQSVLDLFRVLTPSFGVVDGIVGMQGNGPILGVPINSGVVLAGKNLLAVDQFGLNMMAVGSSAPLIDLATQSGLGPASLSQVVGVGDTWAPLNFMPATPVWPYLLPPQVTGQVSHSGSSTLQGTLNVAFACSVRLDVALYTPGSPGTVVSVKTLMNWTAVQPGSLSAAWDGTNYSGVKVPVPTANRRYLFRATAAVPSEPTSPSPSPSKCAFGTAKINVVA